jgi:2-oxoisovalerate dehydrogenase E1 component
VVFGVADNGLSISYATLGYVDTLFAGDRLVPEFIAHGGDMMDVYDKTFQAVAYARRHSAPAVVLYKNLVRRFGHAASDRQTAYLDESQIQAMADHCVVERNLAQAVETGAVSYDVLLRRFNDLQRTCVDAFDMATREPKVDRSAMVSRVSAPAVAVPRLPGSILTSNTVESVDDGDSSTPKTEVMRKLMTRVLAETFESDPSVVYMGEDVQHGGYYVVTEGLTRRFPGRVVDFPPDETSLLGAALGFAQSGLLPIVEIPYAKYLDCGADMFAEIALTYWLSGSSRQNNGMVVRLQGFDRGLFGGNFHTHNALAPPPGVDLLCFSNGEDYVRGFRHALLQAKAGRIVVIVDCTELLNLRHLFGKDRAWERPYPPSDMNGLMNFDEVRRFGTIGRVAIVSFGNGVVAALQARRALYQTHDISCEDDVDIIDCPCVSFLCFSHD